MVPSNEKASLMQRMIARCSHNVQPLEFRCYIDTVGYYFPRLAFSREVWQSICKTYGAIPHRYQNFKKRFMVLTFQCPQPELLILMADLCDEFHGNLSRLDVSADAIGDAREAYEFLKHHMLMIGRKGDPFDEFREGDNVNVYFMPLGRKHARDICMYCDRPSKLDPSGPNVAHFDLRLRGRALAKSAINHHDVTQLDPEEVILRHVRFVDWSQQQYQRKVFKNVMMENTLIDATQIITDMKRHGQLDYVQRAHDRSGEYPYPNVTLITNNRMVTLPGKVTWGAQRRALAGQHAKGRNINDVHHDEYRLGRVTHGETVKRERLDPKPKLIRERL